MLPFESINKERAHGWYQKFKFDKDGNIHSVVGQHSVKSGTMRVGRIPAKIKAIKNLFPKDFTGKSLLDIGCHLGYYCFEATQRGAVRTVGIDRGRKVESLSNLAELNNRAAKQWDVYKNCEFYDTNIGKSWDTYGKFDIILCFSVYHHIYAQALSHDKIFKWFNEHLNDGGYIAWEGPINDRENSIPKIHIPKSHIGHYNEKELFCAARKYFPVIQYYGNCLPEKGRYVYKITR